MPISLIDTLITDTAEIPHTTCTIDRDGIVYREDGSIIESLNHSGGDVVPSKELNPDFNEGMCQVVILKLVAFKRLTLPQTYWELLTCTVKDGDISNLAPDNLIAKPLDEHVCYVVDGVKYNILPLHNRYGITRDGIIYDSKEQRLMSGGVSLFGSLVAYVEDNMGEYEIIEVARLLVMAYMKHPLDFNNYLVGHRDGHYANIELDNLAIVPLSHTEEI